MQPGILRRVNPLENVAGWMVIELEGCLVLDPWVVVLVGAKIVTLVVVSVVTTGVSVVSEVRVMLGVSISPQADDREKETKAAPPNTIPASFRNSLRGNQLEVSFAYRIFLPCSASSGYLMLL